MSENFAYTLVFLFGTQIAYTEEFAMFCAAMMSACIITDTWYFLRKNRK